MKTRSTSTKLVISVAGLVLFGTTIVAFTQRTSSGVARTSVCVKDNGQMRMLTGGAAACDASERQVELVTDVRVGTGLVASRENGSVNLALDPSFLETCGSCNGGRIFAGFDDGPRDMPLLNPFGGPVPQIAKLDLPAGDYAIFVKMTLDNFSQLASPKSVHCRLEAGTDFDEARVDLESGPGFPEAEGISRLGLTLQVVHHFDDPGSAVLMCGDSRFLSIAKGVQYEDLKIIAMKASNISNVFLGSN